MPITLRQLEIFAAVARNNSISKAALELGLSQPAVSKQIQQMEKHLGVPVVDIIRQRVHITEMGNKVLNHARRFEELLNDLNNTVNDSEEELSGDLRLGTGTSLGGVVVHNYAQFLKDHPKVSLRLRVGNREQMNADLMDNKIDLLLAPRDFKYENIETIQLKRFNFVVVAHKKNPLTKKPRIKIDDLADERFIRYSYSWYEGALLGDFFKDHPKMRVIDINNISTIKYALTENLGVALLPDYMLEGKDSKNLEILNVKGFPIPAYINLVHLKHKKLTQTMLAFKEYIKQHFELHV